MVPNLVLQMVLNLEGRMEYQMVRNLDLLMAANLVFQNLDLKKD